MTRPTVEATRIVWARRASIQLEKAKDDIARQAPFAVAPYIDRVLELVEELGRYPDIGRVVPEYENSRIRERIFGKDRIIYTVEEDSLRILALIHDAQ